MAFGAGAVFVVKGLNSLRCAACSPSLRSMLAGCAGVCRVGAVKGTFGEIFFGSAEAGFGFKAVIENCELVESVRMGRLDSFGCGVAKVGLAGEEAVEILSGGIEPVRHGGQSQVV
jgi:hypothetical protein